MERSRALYKGNGGVSFVTLSPYYHCVPELPPSIEVGDLLVLCVVWKDSAFADFTLDETGWTLNNNGTFKTGLGTESVNSGSVGSTVLYKISDGSEVSQVGVLFESTVTSAQAIILCFSKPPDYEWYFILNGHFSYSGIDIIEGTSWYASSDITYPYSEVPISLAKCVLGDLIVTVSGINSNLYSFSNSTVIQPGATIILEEETIDMGSSEGNHQTIVISQHRCTEVDTSFNLGILYQMNSSGSNSTSPTGTTSIFIPRVRPCGKLKRWTGTEWLWCPAKRYYSPNWVEIDNTSSGKLIKRYDVITDSWILISVFNFNIDETTLTFDYNGVSQNKSLTSGHEVNIISSDLWLTISPETIHGDGTVIVSVAELGAGEPSREGDIYLRIEDIQYKTFHIYQNAGPTPSISNDGNKTWSNTGDLCSATPITITANCDWYIDEVTSPTWLHFSQTTGSSLGEIIIYGIVDVGEGVLSLGEVKFYSTIDNILRTTCFVRRLEGDCV